MLIFWDIDGTLMHCGADGTIALNKTFEKLYNIKGAFNKMRIGRMMDSAILETLMNEYNIPSDDLDKISSTYIEILDEILEANENKVVLPGVRELLFFAEREGHINSLLTSNLKAGAYSKLKSVNLDGHFVGGGFGDMKGEKWDTAKRAVEEIESLTEKKIKPDEVLVIGDGVYDIKTARRLGYHIISVATGWTDKEELEKENPDILFDSLQDVDVVIDVINRMSVGK